MEEVKTPEVEEPEEKPENKIEKKRNWKKILIIFGIIFVIVMTGGYIYSNNPAFCGSCHELQVAYDTWKSSTHRNVHCVDCHSEPGLFNKVKGKFERFYYGYAHLTDIYTKPIKIKVPISNEACETCHTRNRVVSPGGDLVVPHEHHITEVGLRCSDCHSNLHISAEESGKATSTLTGPGFYHPLCWTECHNGINATNKCSACHTKKALPKTHREADFAKEHGGKYSQEQDCAKCHGYTPDFCRDCHDKSPSSHLVGNYKGEHRLEIENKGLSNCMACHAEDNICLRCHD